MTPTGTLTRFSATTARESLGRLSGTLERLGTLIDRLPPAQAASIAAELFPVQERLDALACHLERLVVPPAGQSAGGAGSASST